MRELLPAGTPPPVPPPTSAPSPTSALAPPRGAWIERAEFLGIDAVLAIEELIGLRMSNRAKDGRE
jgi:hypothetical protein